MDILSGLQSDFTGTVIELLYRIPAVLIALTLHELAHGYVALKCGDPTAQMLGRLTFNPLKHLTPIGTIMMILFRVGFAKPVPVNPRNFKHYRRDDLLVSIAGVTVNFILFFLTTWLIFGLNQALWKPEFLAGKVGMDRAHLETAQRSFLRMDGIMNMAFYQLVTYPADSAADLMRTPWLIYVQRFLMTFSIINLCYCLFNLLPIPPLDGYHVVNDIFLRGKLHIPAKVVNALAVGLLFLVYFSSFFSVWFSRAVQFVQGGVAEMILAICGMG